MARNNALADLATIRRNMTNRNPSADLPIVRCAKWAESAREHQAPVAAVRRRDPDNAERWASEDMVQAMLAPMKLHQMHRMDRATR